MKFYTFKVVIEEDSFEDGKEAYHAYVPILEENGASTWGYTKEEALKNLQEVVTLVIESMIEHREPIPEEPQDQVIVSHEPMVTVGV